MRSLFNQRMIALTGGLTSGSIHCAHYAGNDWSFVPGGDSCAPKAVEFIEAKIEGIPTLLTIEDFVPQYGIEWGLDTATIKQANARSPHSLLLNVVSNIFIPTMRTRL